MRSLFNSSHRCFRPTLLLIVALCLGTVATTASAAVFTVTTVVDSVPGSLRQALIDANTAAGLDTINFNIIGGGVQNILPLSALPDITDRVAIFGYTQGTATTNTAPAWGVTNTNIQIQIDGVSAGAGVSGLTFAAGSAESEVRGLAIFDFTGSGITITADSVWVHGCFIGLKADASPAGNGSQGINISGVAVSIGGNLPAYRNIISNSGFHGVAAGGDDALIAGNFIGTDAGGTVSMSNGQNGVMLTGGAQGVIVGGPAPGHGNLISGNTFGVFISGTSSSTFVWGNRIGTNAAGTGSIGNSIGVLVQGDNNFVGGTSSNHRNIISGNTADGVRITAGGTLNLIQGNYIGTDPTGAVAVGNGLDGVEIDASPANVVGGTNPGARNLISGNASGQGVHIHSAGADNNDVFLNLIGTNVSGTVAIPNLFGVRIASGASGNRIGDGTNSSAWNVISGNTFDGVQINNATLNTVEGNRIGTAINGTSALGNGEDGVDIQNGAANNVIGGTNAFSRNIISGNTQAGVNITSQGGPNTVSGNFIGTSTTSQAAIANGSDGIRVQGSANNTIGGTTAGAGNVISGNTQQGISIFSSFASGNMIYGNTIGADSSRTSSIPNSNGILIQLLADSNIVGGPGGGEGNFVTGNTNFAIFIDNSTWNTIQGNSIDKNGGGVFFNNVAANNLLGGTNPGEGNTILNNGGYGVLLEDVNTTLNVIQGNNIGATGFGNATWGIGISNSPNNTIGGSNLGDRNFISGNGDSGIEISGVNATGNTIQNNQIGGAGQGNTANGIHILNSASNNTIGGTNLGEGNEISHNGGAGVVAVTGTDNEIIGNSVHSNTGMGIDLSADGVTANDPGDVDAGPNNLQNYPVIVVATQSDSTRVTGLFASAASTQYRLEFFGNAVCDATTYGEGNTYLGFMDVTTSGAGSAAFTASFSTLVPVGFYVTATATDPTGNTSEFSSCVQVTSGPFIVTSPNNTGAGSLRAAINAANASPGPDSIHFNVTGGPYSIVLANALPFISDEVVIDGYTEPGASVNTLAGFNGWTAVVMVTLDGNATVDSAGFFLGNGADNCTIRGLAITRFLADGISVGGNGNAIEGCKITANTGHGIAVGDGSHVVGGTNASQRNVVSGNGGSGIFVTNDSAQISVYGNLIGTNDSGTVDDGNTQDGVRVSGSALATIGGTVLGSGNVISGNDGRGVGLSGVTGVLVSGNRIGTSVDGTIPIGNGVHGVLIVGGTGNEVSDNVIAFNSQDGINLSSTTGNQIFINSIGVDVSGVTAGANGSDGVEIFNSSFTDIGGSVPAQRNTISGNGGDGVRMSGASSQSNKVYGNYIGTDITGTLPIPNGGRGVAIESTASNNQIGTTVAGTGNLISGNTTHGIEIDGSDNNFVQGNSIGVDATGSTGLANGNAGVHLGFGSSNNTIGGTVGTATNVIAGNSGDGIAIIGTGTSFNVVKGNLIGHDGANKIPNANGVRISAASHNTIGGADGGNHIAGNGTNGISIVTASADSNTVGANTIGGSPALDNAGHGIFVGSGTMVGNVIASVGGGPGNTISFNGLSGITVGTGATETTIRQNAIFQNGQFEIDLGADGTTLNDVGDGDVGANELQNFPTVASSTNNSTRVIGGLNSTPNTSFTLDFYSTDVCDPTGYGGSIIYLGSANVLTNGSGDAAYDETFPTTVAAGHYVTSTATDPNGNTSEFSLCSQVASDFDLQIVSFSATASATVQDDIAGTISLRVRNDGASPISGPILVGLYHSVDDTIRITDRFVSRATLPAGLGAASEVDVSFTVARLPFETALGAGYLGVIADEFDTIIELDETDNTASSPITINGLSAVGEVVVYFDSLLTERAADCPGLLLDTLYVAAQNLGTYISGAEYKIDYPTIMNFIGDLNTPPVTIGSSDVGISIAWALPQDSRTSPTELHRVLVEWTCDDCLQFDDPIIVSAHPNGWVQTVAWPSGDIVVAGGGISTICVDSDGDSVFNGVDLCPQENALPHDFDKDGCVDFDLQIVEFLTDDGATVQDDVASTIELSIFNDGHSDIAGPLLIGLYHSVDDTIRITDRFVSRATLPGGIGAGEQLDVSFTTAKLPFETPLGAGFLGVIADEFDLITESIETNNTASSGIFIDPLAPVGEVAVYFDSLFTQREADCPGFVFDTLYVTAQDLGTYISGAEYKIDYPAIMTYIGDLDTPPVTIGFSNTGISVAWALPQDSRTNPTELHKVVVQWTCDDCVQFDDPISVSAHSNGWVQAVAWPSGDIVVANGGLSTICVDSDGDGVYNGPDLCPLDNAAPYDVDGDGCRDLAAGNRRVEYWTPPDFPIIYQMNAQGAPGIGDASDFTEIQMGMNTWNGVAGSDAEYEYFGATTQSDANPMDLVNLVTFNDPDFVFPSGVLAVGIATSYVAPTHSGGELFRDGQLFDFDMIFNKSISFSTATAGTGPRILGVTVHEAGHGLGFAHSIVQESAMAYVLSLTADVLKPDDELMAFMHYSSDSAKTAANQIGGTITDGYTTNALEAAIVFARSATTGDTTGCALTLSDGSYMFVGLPDDDYFISVYPIDSSSTINFIRPGNINPVVAAVNIVDFVPEHWDALESDTDDSNAKDGITVSGGTHVLDVDIITNVDNTPPTVVDVSPMNGALDVPIGSAVLVRFSESMDTGTIAGNVTLIDVSAIPPDTSGLGGFVSLDDSLLTLLPSTSLNFSAVYELTVKQGVTDKFDNMLSGGDFVSTFTTEAQPPVFITSLEPTSGPVGTIVTIEGEGFEPNMVDNRVEFDGVQGVVQSAGALQLVVEVPLGATSGQVQVFNDAQPSSSNVLPFSVLEPKAVSQGSDAGSATVGAIPRAMTILPDASQAFVATTEGFSIVETDADLPSFLNSTAVLVPGGLDAIDINPVGNRAYAISSTNSKLYRINVDEVPVDVDVEVPIPTGTPLGVHIGPGGLRAFVTTDLGEIAIFDINQANTTTFETQVGSITAVPTIRGQLALAGADYLLGLSGAGELLVFDLATDALAHQIAVGFDPRGVVANPQGDIAYVTDDDGKIHVVSLLTFTNLTTIITGGSLREVVVTPDGAFLFAVNRQLNVFSVIDLRTESSTFHQNVASPTLGINPTAAKIGSNGLFAFATSEEEMTLNAIAIGTGPTLETVVPLAAPTGSPLVLSGEGFTADATTEVSFDGLLVVPDVLTDSTIVVTVPPVALSGPITIRGTNPVGPDAISNAIFFTVLSGPTPVGATRISGAAQPGGAPGLNAALAMSPIGDLSVVGGDTGVLYFLDTDPASTTFNQFFDEGLVLGLLQVDDVVITPDGKRAFVLEEGNTSIQVVNSDRFSSDFTQVVGLVDLSGISGSNPLRMITHPDGRRLYITDDGTVKLHIVDIEVGSGTQYQVLNSIGLDQTADGSSLEMGFHPEGQYLYVCGQEATMSVIMIIDVIAETWVADYAIGGPAPQEIPISLSFTPDGNTCMVLTSQFFAIPNRTVRSLDTSDPMNPVEQDAFVIALNNTPTREHLQVSPVGDRVLLNVRDSGYYYLNIGDPTNILLIEAAGDPFHHLTQLDFGYTPDASRFYSVSAFRDSAFAQDFAEPQGLALDSGDGQLGIAGQQLPLPIKAIATNISGGAPAAGVAVTFDVTLGGGTFVGSGTATQTVLTGADGIASAQWTLGPDVGIGKHTATATALGLVGSPVAFTADADADPNTLPLVMLTLQPPDNELDVAITTNIQATFRRAVDPTSIDPGTFRLIDGSTIVPVSYGFADSDRKVSMTPAIPLDDGTTYTIELTGGIKDMDGGSLEDLGGPLAGPLTFTFDTQPPPPLSLNSVDPPSGVVGTPVVISGVGINPDPTQNTVMFPPGIPAVVTAAGADFLNVSVPLGAISGQILVDRLSTASSGPMKTSVIPEMIEFTVLVPAAESSEEVIGSIGTGNLPPTSIAMTPDGTRAYATSTNSIIKIDVISFSSGASIPAGIDPIAIEITPDGKYAYVANNGSNTVSIINVDPTNTTEFETNVGDVNVGSSPIDLVIHPNGDIVYIANAGTNDISLLDADLESATHNAVIGVMGGGNQGGMRSLSITPDGTLLYVGGTADISILNPQSGAVIGNVGTGNTAMRSLSITPDGTKLVALSATGQILVFDIVEGSPTHNRVIGVFGGGNQQTQSLSMTPDGAQIWAVQELNDEILILSLNFDGGVGVIEIPETAVELTVLATIDAGEDPAFVIHDPSGSGLTLVTNPGDNTITVLQPVAAVDAVVTISPRDFKIWNPNPPTNEGGQGLHLKSGGARYVEASIELPTAPTAFLPEDIVEETVRLFQGMIGENGGLHAVVGESVLMDEDENGVNELHVKFDRLDIQLQIPLGADVPLLIKGNVNSVAFTGRDTVTTQRPEIVAPSGGVSIPPGMLYDIEWLSPAGVAVDAVNIFWTPNDGTDWYPIAQRIEDTGSFEWITPEGYHGECRLFVVLYQGGVDIGATLSQEMFSIGTPESVALADVRLTSTKHSARILWTTSFEGNIEGFHVLRSRDEESGYQRITTEILEARGAETPYQFDDEDVHLNNTYFYKLQEVSGDRAGQMFGPYEFVYRAPFALEQNAPNPFNPTTVIRFTVPQDSPVKLAIYDVAGRLVRTLINGSRRADHYEVTWDGKDAHGRAVASGVYFYRLQAGSHLATKKMVMLK